MADHIGTVDALNGHQTTQWHQARLLLRLKLSAALAAKISGRTNVDMGWILANDTSVPMPPRPFPYRDADADYVGTLSLLADVFSRLFATAKRLKKTFARDALELTIAEELSLLKKERSRQKSQTASPGW
jgi:hypothetical protein